MSFTLPKVRGKKSGRLSREDLVPPLRPAANLMGDFSSAIESYSSRNTSALDIPDIPVYNREKGRIHRFFRSVTAPSSTSQKHKSDSCLPQQIRSISAAEPRQIMSSPHYSLPELVPTLADTEESVARTIPQKPAQPKAQKSRATFASEESFDFKSIIEEYASRSSSEASLNEPYEEHESEPYNQPFKVDFNQMDEVTSIYSVDSCISGFSFGGVKSPTYKNPLLDVPPFKIPRIDYCLDLGADYGDSRFRVSRKVIA